MKTVILAGGMGSRLGCQTQSVPKPMVDVGGSPILWHIMNLYGSQGFDEFVIALGYQGDVIRKYCRDLHLLGSDLTVDTVTGRTIWHSSSAPNWTIHLIETGLNTKTGGRIKRLARWLRDEPCFMLTYGDGLADIDLKSLLAFHNSHGRLATVTAIQKPESFGRFKSEGNMVTEFYEKAVSRDSFINGGFFVLNPAVLEYIDGDETAWEREPLERLVADQQLMCYQHEGFWQCMDTPADRALLEQLWAGGSAPWVLRKPRCAR